MLFINNLFHLYQIIEGLDGVEDDLWRYILQSLDEGLEVFTGGQFVELLRVDVTGQVYKEGGDKFSFGVSETAHL